MKCTWRQSSFCVSGKGWQVRAYLRQLTNHPLTVKQLIERKQCLFRPLRKEKPLHRLFPNQRTKAEP
ncbi:hypothetical protein ADL26_00210 [Thermoactinomyces vulgaris]|nr:hypothetical protein ADL26_00210 [Thermoactinomyces vulgaris]